MKPPGGALRERPLSGTMGIPRIREGDLGMARQTKPTKPVQEVRRPILTGIWNGRDALRKARGVLLGSIAQGQEIDMGTPFVLFDVRSHTDNPAVQACLGSRGIV